MTIIRDTDQGVEFNVRVQPRSAKNGFAGIYGDALKIKLTAPPVEGAANQMCIAFLAKSLGVAKSTVEIVSGHTGRSKRIRIHCPAGPEGNGIRSELHRQVAALL